MVMARFKSFLLVSLLFGLSMFTSSAQTDDFYALYEKFRKYAPDVSFCAWQWQVIALVRGNVVP